MGIESFQEGSLKVLDRLRSVPKILLVSNKWEGGSLLDFSLEQQPAHFITETDLARALETFENESPDLLILDVDLDKAVIVDFIGSLRPHMYIPILLLASEASETFMLEAYNAGVDDFILMPVNSELLHAKISVWLRRSWSAGPGILDPVKIGQLQLIPSDKMLVLESNETIRLTNLEVRLLYNLMRRVGHAVTVEELTEKIWGYSGEVDNTLVKNVVYRLRRKIESDPAKPSIIETVSGVGYRLTAQ